MCRCCHPIGAVDICNSYENTLFFRCCCRPLIAKNTCRPLFFTAENLYFCATFCVYSRPRFNRHLSCLHPINFGRAFPPPPSPVTNNGKAHPSQLHYECDFCNSSLSVDSCAYRSRRVELTVYDLCK